MPKSAASQPLFLYSTTVSDVGTVRANNQDSSFAGEHLIAMCDGMGGHAGGDTASSIAIRSLAHIEQDDTGGNVETISRMMETSVMAAHDAIVGKAKRERKLAGMGTTVTAVALVAGYWVIAHIGDSRAYLLRDGRLSRITCDHSYVQHLINTGRITPSEAKNHPQRNVVMRVLGEELRRHQHQKQRGGNASAVLRSRYRQRRTDACAAKGHKVHDGHAGKLHDKDFHGDFPKFLGVLVHIRLPPCVRAEELQLLQPLHAV